MIPEANLEEARVVEGVRCIPVASLAEAVAILTGEQEPREIALEQAAATDESGRSRGSGGCQGPGARQTRPGDRRGRRP